MKKRLLVISADAMVTQDTEYMSTLPNFKKYLSGGTRVDRVRSIYPTLTYPAHTSILTGCFPDKTGIVNNIVFSEDADSDLWEWDARAVRVPDILTSAKKGGYTTASVLWPVTGHHPGVDFLINEYWLPIPGETVESAFKQEGSSDDMIKIIQRNWPVDGLAPDPENCSIHPVFDDFGIRCAADIIRIYQPEVFFIHTSPIDTIRHQYGVFNDHLNNEIMRVDKQLGMIAEALCDVDLLADTNIVLLSDHGQMNSVRTVNPNVLFVQNNLMRVNENGCVTDWQACCRSSGMSAYIYLRNPKDEQLYSKTKQLLERLCSEGVWGFSMVYAHDEICAKEHLGGDFSFVLETDGYSSFGHSCVPPYITFDEQSLEDCRSHGKHGYHPDKGPQPVFFAKGPDFAKDVCIPFCRLVDEAPTFARLLGVPLEKADGEPVTAMLRTQNDI